MAPRKFGDTTWDVWRPEAGAGLNRAGWQMPSDHGRYIGNADYDYWAKVLGDARKTYGDPEIHFNTDNTDQQRYMVFGDGTRLPSDGTVVYHDGHTKENFIQHDNGAVQLAGPDGKALPGAPEVPAAYRRSPDGHVAPINAHGQQIGPLATDVPSDKGQTYYDDGRGVLTPTNGRGDYYTLDDSGDKHYFDKSGRPITKEQYDCTPATAPAAPSADGVSTDEEDSGRAADAIRKVKADAEQRNSNLNVADARLAELMLSAHAASADGRAALQGMQQDIIRALNDPGSDLGTPAGELQFLKLLRDKAATAYDLVQKHKISDGDLAKMAEALADFYRQGSNGGSDQPGDPSAQPASPAPGPAPGAPSGDPGGLGPPPAMPSAIDPGLAGGSPLGDPLSSAAPLIPGLLSGLGSPLSAGGLGGGPDLGGLTRPIGDAIQAAADHDHKDDDKTGEQPKPGEKPGEKAAVQAPQVPAAPAQPAPGTPPPAPGTAPGPGMTPPAPAQTTAVDLKDGSSVTAADVNRAGAARAALSGTPVGECYRENNLAAPPPGTTLTNYVPPDRLEPADFAMYRDKLIMVLGPDKFVGEDGRIESIKDLPQGDFLGFGRPTALSTPSPATAVSQGSVPTPSASVAPPVQPSPAPPPPSAPQ